MSDREDEISREIEAHLELEAADRRDLGDSPSEATAAARRAFGNVTSARERTRDVWIRPAWENLWRDLAHAVRGIALRPTFSATAILSLAIGIGAATAAFSLVDRLLFRSLPYAAHSRLVSAGISIPQMPYDFLFAAMYLDARQAMTDFESMASWTAIGNSECDLEVAQPIRLRCVSAESSLLPVLGVVPALGRNFTRDEDRPGSPRVALLSHAIWRTHFGGEATVIEHSITVDGSPVRIVGVLPPDFEMPSLARADLLLPQAFDEAAIRKSGQGRPLRVIARLRHGVTLEDARSRAGAWLRPYLKGMPPPMRDSVQLRIEPIRDLQTGSAKTASWLVTASMVVFLVIAVANFANLLLARAMSRERETAVRSALGAGAWRLARQALIESSALAAIAGIAGAGLAHLLVRLAVSLAPEGIPKLAEASVDGRVLAFATVASLASGLLAGVAPALRKPQLSTISAVRAGREGWLRPSLLAFQIAASLVLVTVSALFLRSLWHLQTSASGMRVENVVAVPLSLGSRHSSPERQLAFLAEAESRLRELPGVTAVAAADSIPPAVPLRSQPWSAFATSAVPSPHLPGTVVWRSVTPGYFALLDIPILEGRSFREQDREPGAAPVILSQSLARALFPSRSAVGEPVRIGGPDGALREVIGIARDVRNGVSPHPQPEYYAVRSNSPGHFVYRNPEGIRKAVLLVRGLVSEQALVASIRSAMAALDPSLPVEPAPLRIELDRLAARPRFISAVLAAFAIASLLLAAVGVFGAASFRVAGRTREIGVRMALGATAGRIVRWVIAGSAGWVAVGAFAGLALSFAAASLLRSMLYGVSEWDPSMPAACLAIVGLVCLLATWLPARRATRVDPAAPLRE